MSQHIVFSITADSAEQAAAYTRGCEILKVDGWRLGLDLPVLCVDYSGVLLETRAVAIDGECVRVVNVLPPGEFDVKHFSRSGRSDVVPDMRDEIVQDRMLERLRILVDLPELPLYEEGPGRWTCGVRAHQFSGPTRADALMTAFYSLLGMARNGRLGERAAREAGPWAGCRPDIYEKILRDRYAVPEGERRPGKQAERLPAEGRIQGRVGGES